MAKNLIPFCVFLVIPISCEKLTDNEDLEGEGGYYDTETPPDWVDWMFAIFMIFHHIYYAYKFTDYSLSHIHSTTDLQQKKIKKKAKKQKKKMKKKMKKKKKRAYNTRKVYTPTTPTTPNDDPFKKLDKIREDKATKVLKRAASIKNFTTASNSSTKRRSMSTYVCCCIRCAPRYFTWQRTAIIRLFFRIYTSISCLLALVLYMEFFMNLFVEFFITCIVHYKQGYIVCLLLLPLMIYVIETLIRLSWHSVYVSWQINCDSNGDFESVESDGEHHFNLEGNRFLFSYKMDYGDIDDEYDSAFITSSDLSETTTDSSSSESSSTHSDPMTPPPGFTNVDSHSTNPILDLAVIEEEVSHLVKKKGKSGQMKRRHSDIGKVKSKSNDSADEERPYKKERALTDHAHLDGVTSAEAHREKGYLAMKQIQVDYRNGRRVEKYKQEKEKQREKKRKERDRRRLKIIKEKEEAKEKRRKMIKEQREMMGDYFLATCWRVWFCIGTMFAALVASYTIKVEVAVNGFFWQLVMRYCIIGGFIWSVVYTLYALILSFMSRMMSWKLLHPDISRIKFFCLVDAKDHEKRNKRWRNCKICTMMCSLILCAAFIALGVRLDQMDNNAAGFAVFIGIIWISYYFTNLFMSCKPMGLIALWTDTIPPPGKNFFAHYQVTAHLEETGQLEHTLQLSNVDSQGVRVGTNTDLELARFNSEKTLKSNSNKQQRHKPIRIKISVDDVSALSEATGVSAYAPSVEPSNASKSQQEFVAGRATALLNRYGKFGYKYKEPEDFPNKKGRKPSKYGCRYWCLKMRLFWNNYKNYWLNVYRPFDEYDMETNLSSTHILKGFQWIKPCLECRCFKKKSTIGKCGKCCTYLMDNTCSICLILLSAALIGTLFFFASQFGIYSTTDMLLGSTVTQQDTKPTQYYPICSEYFGADSNSNESARSESDLTVLDVLFLSQVVYEMDNFKIDEIIDIYFDGEFDIINSEYEVPFYFHIKHKTEDMDYVAIRGTAGLQEALQDISLFVEVALFEGLQWLVPFLNALPTSFVTALIYYASLTEQLINADVRDQFDQPIYDYLSDYLDNTTTSMHILGHSLGGGISTIVAAQLFEDGYDSYITSFGVCSPGALYSSAKFGFGVEALDKTSRSLLPRRDLISKLDIHGGMIQYTNCKEESMLHCHVMPSVICEVYNNCPKHLAKKPQIFDCYCNDVNEMGQQFGYCLNATTI